MDPDDHCRFRITGMFCVLSIFPISAIALSVSMARKNTAGSSEQGNNAY
jgi:hypothetical protein